MKERITGQNNDGMRSADVVVQWHSNLQYVGIGIEHDSSKPEHFLDQIYSNAPTLTDIGRILNSRMNEFGWDIREFNTDELGTSSVAKEEWYAAFGRAVLDAVSESTPDPGLWSWFDRPAVNRLVRLLRKARDNAFGRDE